MAHVRSAREATMDYHSGKRLAKERGLLTQVEFEAEMAKTYRHQNIAFGSNFSGGYYDGLKEAGVWTPGQGIPAPWADWPIYHH